MTNLLKDTLTRQADNAEPPLLDLDALITAGTRRSRRRTAVTALTTSFVSLAVLATGFTAVRAIGNDDPAPAGRPASTYAEHRPAYAVGDVVHYGSQTIKAAGKVTSLVQTDTGLVFATGQDRTPGQVTLLDDSGKHVLGGPTQHPGLMSDGHSVVAWFEDAKPGEPNGARVVYDVAQHRTIRRLPIDAATMNGLAKLERGSAYVWVGSRLDRIDLATGKRTTVSKDVGARSIVDVSGSTYLYTEPDGDTGRTLYLGELPGHGSRRTPLGVSRGDHPWGGSFSSDGTHAVAWRGDDVPLGRLQLRTVPAGQELPIKLTAYPLQSFAGWLDEDRFAMVAAKGSKAPADLLTCSISASNCTVTQKNIAPSVLDRNLVLPS